jgi:DNA-binding MarR family transcriptional regulator
MMMSSKNNTPAISLRDLTTYQVGATESAAHRALRKHKDACLQEYGITGMQWYIIGTVLDAGRKGIRITDLADQLGTTMAFMTNTVNLLESKTILARSESGEDSRSRAIHITPKFKPQCKKIEAELRAKLRKSMYSKVTPEELAIYVKVMTKFTELD